MPLEVMLLNSDCPSKHRRQLARLPLLSSGLSNSQCCSALSSGLVQGTLKVWHCSLICISKYMSTEKWIDKLCYIYKVEIYTAMKKNELLAHATT